MFLIIKRYFRGQPGVSLALQRTLNTSLLRLASEARLLNHGGGAAIERRAARES